MPNIHDVAKASNVSIATVSRILNDDKKLVVLDETRQRVLTAVEQLGYSPVKGRGRKKQKQITLPRWKIAILTWNSMQDDKEDPYFKEIIYGIEDKADELNLQIDGTYRLRSWDDSTSLDHLDGIIVIGKSVDEDLELIFPKTNIVFVDRSPNKQKYDSVVPDLEQASANTLQHLLDLGHRNIGFIGGREFTQRLYAPNKEALDARLIYYERFMKEKELYRTENVFLGNDKVGDWSSASGYALMKQALKLKSVPSAFFVSSDPIALGAMRALHEEGYRIPEDISIASVDDIDFAQYVTPPLTTTKLFSRQIGMSSVQLLKERIEGRETPLTVVVSTELKIRQSTGRRES